MGKGMYSRYFAVHVHPLDSFVLQNKIFIFHTASLTPNTQVMVNAKTSPFVFQLLHLLLHLLGIAVPFDQALGITK